MDLVIRPVEARDLEILDRTFRSEFGRSHADDLHDQKANEKCFLVAWLDDAPVGHALVRWLGPRAEEPGALCPDCPEIYRLAVLEEHRRQGIATALIRRSEAEARIRGFKRIGLGTDPELGPDANLYRRLGYRPTKAERFKESYRRQRDDGTVETIEELTTFLAKDLPVVTRVAAGEDDRAFFRELNELSYRDVVTRQFGGWDEDLQGSNFQAKWKEQQYQKLVVDGTLIGGIWTDDFDDHIRIREIQIHPDHRGRGIGGTILAEEIDRAHKVGKTLRLRVLLENRAYGLYRRFGFEAVSRNETHYEMVYRVAAAGSQ